MGGRSTPGDPDHRTETAETEADDRLVRSKMLLEVVWLGLKVALLIAGALAVAFGILPPEQVL